MFAFNCDLLTKVVVRAIEWLVNLILILEPLKQIRNAAIEKLQATLFRLKLNDYQIEKVAKDLTPSALAPIRSRIGILSLSERYDCLPMWAHYADQAKGFVVVFENLESSFTGDNTGSLNIPKPVVYNECFLSMTFDPSTQDRLFFSKLVDRFYEREWRVVRALGSCHRTPDGKLYLRDVNPLHLTGVVCGWRVSKGDYGVLIDALQRVNPDARLIPAMLDGGRVSLTESLS